MSKIQFVQTTPDELENLIKESVKDVIEKIESNLANTSEQEKILTRSEAAKLLDINPSSLWRWTKKGKIKAFGIENRVYYYLSDINKALIPIN
ncbi:MULTISPECIES: helix-turn-helix domain-containing protein [Elizabethkingia]|uniref:helix-turn-helix domain-containing protein n=1 Tax=Elizabethkingia TaxID=308865 RepID=UPI000840568B|nr:MULTISPECIES: helix-turn-helix domain-containing protein [Elizabethkingia]MCT3638477.1 helix-turn-helix domain-containing protein [Elizabethkingia anophelis]MCT3742600.1 helix-turn-helix domain-containing protein [Elizabethkingia anophelis]MCT3749791.1 helix-turn-helix domain-containing protein [Elizabethkingia anophelis]MCT3753377.1 helix-turn-helix domain-containing protein [Elizabethkingia anophelis]MCT3871051.1 helix-turn-helix domain-containing protein [Elizabethkingia anophelis]